MSKEMKEKYPKPEFISEEAWDEYLKSVEELGENILKLLTGTIIDINEEMNR